MFWQFFLLSEAADKLLGGEAMERYQRQLQLTQIGEQGQKRLQEARVTVIGAGGLGSPVLTYLTEAGVGHIRCIDDDVVSITNLNRQFLHGEPDIGKKKTDSAKETLECLNSALDIETVYCKVTEENAEKLIEASCVVVDCVDNMAARLSVNAACLKNKIPLVEGGISGFYGFVTVISPEYACLECMGYNKSMDKKEIPVLGTTAGVIGALQANECLKVILGAGEPLYGRILQYDGLTGGFDEIPVMKREDCKAHGTIK